MSNLTKGLTGVGIATGVVGIANEVMGAFTNAEAWYNGKFSIANRVKYLLALTPGQREALLENMSDILNSFGDIENKEVQELLHIKADPKSEKSKAVSLARTMLDMCAPDTMKKADGKAGDVCTVIANGFVIRDSGNNLVVEYYDKSILLNMEYVKTDKNGAKVRCKIKSVFTINKDGSLTFEFINTGIDGLTLKCTFPKIKKSFSNSNSKRSSKRHLYERGMWDKKRTLADDIEDMCKKSTAKRGVERIKNESKMSQANIQKMLSIILNGTKALGDIYSVVRPGFPPEWKDREYYKGKDLTNEILEEAGVGRCGDYCLESILNGLRSGKYIVTYVSTPWEDYKNKIYDDSSCEITFRDAEEGKIIDGGYLKHSIKFEFYSDNTIGDIVSIYGPYRDDYPVRYRLAKGKVLPK